MSTVVSVGLSNPPYVLAQEEVMDFARDFYRNDFSDVERLLKVFHNGDIERRYFSAPIKWFSQPRTLKEKNDRYCEMAVSLGIKSINDCLNQVDYLSTPVEATAIDAIYFISTTGMATPSIEARIMNQLPFDVHTKRIPIWGLGCGGGTAGLARADDYCRAYPEANVLVLSIELCSLTFQYGDRSKSNLIGTSLFADGAACVLVSGEQSSLKSKIQLPIVPKVRGSQSTLMPNSEEVMGWDVRDEGLHVVFSKSIPHIVETWLQPEVKQFLQQYYLDISELHHFIAHPGGRKVLDAYEAIFNLERQFTDNARNILRNYGNMSSPTVLYVLDRAMRQAGNPGEQGLVVSLGPGFTSELLLLEWVDAS
ncbi:type III polyketide synthase [Tuberibacillus sp. Marseille-P3662]|uniref:type III polyketide synthase n=1 Tax=Tuberibacillus sp. Marseille-P3662 TaxID=1965358 RepID=UPI00111C5647|nr:3-oxoacyl-[acyl-carrier-protein] synthase III C-terminal domain-containing protein [Tuberibacillus sp. Marseille-P3662]